MNEIIASKSKKTQNRYAEIIIELSAHYQNIEKLNYILANRIQSKLEPHATRKIKFSCLPRSDKTFEFTIKNIKSQIILLERELDVLMEFGR